MCKYSFVDLPKFLGSTYPTTVTCAPYTVNSGRTTVTRTTVATQAILGIRRSDGKIQLLLSSIDAGRTNVGYYIVYNGSDPNATVFNSDAEANTYLNTQFSATPSKLYADHSTEDVTVRYSNLRLATWAAESLRKRGLCSA